MRRREFITLLGGAAAWPFAARAQQQAMPVVGFLDSRPPDAIADRLRGFRQGLRESGYVEGENVVIVYRLANNQDDRLPELAADLARRPVGVIATAGVPSTFAAKAATTTIPIVFVIADDPVRLGLVTSISRPGGNLTGISVFNAEVTAKRLELLRECVPQLTRIALLLNSADPNTEPQLNGANMAARAMGLQIQVLKADTSAEIDAAFATMGRERPDAVLVGTSAFLNGPSARDLCLARVRRSRRADQLRIGHSEWVPSSRPLYRPRSQGRKTGGPAGRASEQIRAGYQPADCTYVRARCPGPAAGHRRRGD
jgi:ABC-type uncharacterized transport system substrate-binding protein